MTKQEFMNKYGFYEFDDSSRVFLEEMIDYLKDGGANSCDLFENCSEGCPLRASVSDLKICRSLTTKSEMSLRVILEDYNSITTEIEIETRHPEELVIKVDGHTIKESDFGTSDPIVEKYDRFHSSHYCEGKIEPVEYIMANKMSFNRGNIIKYGTRAGKKNGQETLDIKKIIDYALLLAIEENIEIDRQDVLKLVNYRFDWKEEDNA